MTVRTLLLTVMLIGGGAAHAVSQVVVRVRVPPDTPAGVQVYIAGTFNNWAPGAPEYRLSRDSSGLHAITLPESPRVRGAIEFKFTLGMWEAVELDSAGGSVPNRQWIVPATGPATYEGSVSTWQNPAELAPRASTRTSSVTILADDFAMPQLGRTRRVWLYLPPDYATSDKRYPVLYMHDGQNLFDEATGYAGEWGVDETLDSLHASGDPGVIVVAVDNGAEHRLDEYSPWTNERYGGGQGDQYVDFLVETLKPYIDARYRTLPDRLNTGIAGSSMGGLISLYALLEHPDVFGRAGVFSPALWFAPGAFEHARGAAPMRPDPRIYFVSGALEGQPGEDSGVYTRDQERMVETLVAAGFAPGAEVVAHVRADGTHSEWFWRREFAAAYGWLFGR